MRAQDKPQRLVSAPAPGAGAVQTEDAQFLEWKKKQDTDQAMTALAIRNAGPRLQGKFEQFAALKLKRFSEQAQNLKTVSAVSGQ